MPNSGEILAGLGRIANEAFGWAVAWHVLLGIGLIALTARRPSPRVAGVLLALPLASVAAFAFAFANPFNGVVFAFLAGAGVLLSMRASSEVFVERWHVVLGLLMIAFAWFYPHFLDARPAHAYLFGAPMGLLPCPTLSLVIGLGLLGYAPSRSWSVLLGAAGGFYALVGAMRLGVRIDLLLLAGAFGLVVQAMATRPVSRRATR